jgi:hypothetical protein
MATLTYGGVTMLTKDFHLSYAGEAEYDIRKDGRLLGRVSVRTFGNSRLAYNGDYFQTGILPQVGTVRWDSSSKWHEFPPAEVVALFPGYVGCRLVFHPRTPGLTIQDEGYELPEVEFQYDGLAPTLCPHPNVPNYVTFTGAESIREAGVLA